MRTIIRRLLTGFTLALASPAFSLGLGELTVSSGLGQPLRASIPLQGNEAELDADCFRVQAVAGNSLPMPQNLRLTPDQSAGKPPLLRLSTKQAINDPVIGFVVQAGCIGTIQKEYALLLDPIEPVPEMQPVALPQTEAVEQPPAPSKPKRTPQAPEEPRKPSATLPDAVSGTTPRTSKPRTTARAERPVLVLSGTRRLARTSEVGDGMSLQLDLSLPDFAHQAKAVPTSADLSDENTALNHKLAYLEQQLASLQKRNAELQRNQPSPESRAPEEKGAQPVPLAWPHYLLGLFVLSAGMAWALHWRRQGKYAEVEEEPANWLSMRNNPGALAPVETELADVEKTSGASLRSLDDDYLPPRAQEGAEIHDSMSDEVEVFVAHGNARLAIRLLENHIRQEPAESPVPWLLLLDLLQREGNTTKYEETRQLCKQHFNVDIPAWGEMEAASGKPGIEAYPHVMAELIHLWPTDRAIPYLDDLLHDNRRGSRAGFSFSAYNDIVLLRSIRDHDVPGPW